MAGESTASRVDIVGERDERVYVAVDTEGVMRAFAFEPLPEPGLVDGSAVEYVRADLHQGAVESLREQLQVAKSDATILAKFAGIAAHRLSVVDQIRLRELKEKYRP